MTEISVIAERAGTVNNIPIQLGMDYFDARRVAQIVLDYYIFSSYYARAWRCTMIIKNCIRCKSCGDVIESEYRHDFKYCSCKRVAVDGGHSYLRRCFTDNQDDYEELSIVENDSKNADNLGQV